jgi:histidinol-phosphatase (PHP family)
MEGPLQADSHVHTQFSWDAPRGDMEQSCRQATELGLPAIAFTEHADFVPKVYTGLRSLDVAGYLTEIERCRSLFPSLRILSGVELGEPHQFRKEAGAVLARGSFERVLGSVHCLDWQGRVIDASQLREIDPADAPTFHRQYLEEAAALVESAAPFEVLAHLGYPKRYWPHDVVHFREEDYEEEYRAVLRGLAARDGVLEVNTTRGAEPSRGFCPGPIVLHWWAEAGGRAVSFGSDAHEAAMVARGFELAAELVEAAGFKPNDDPTGFWLLHRTSPADACCK